ncbi:unnamed protein product [Victoria cruziana]
MSSNPATLLQAAEMATKMEEDYRRSQAFGRRQKGLTPVPYQFKKPSGPSKMPRPPLPRPTASQRYVPIRCPRCTTYHPRGECPRYPVCFHCSQTGHIWRDCPQRKDRAPSVTASSPVTPQRTPTGIAQPRAVPASAEARREVMPAASTSAPALAPQRGRPAGRVYTTSLQDLQSQDLIQGTLLLNEFFVRVLFDTGASHSFIVRQLARQLENEVIVASFVIRISSPLGVKQIDVEYILVEGLYIEDRAFPAQLILLDMTEFDVILGMDWLARHSVLVDCQKRRLIVGPGSQSQRVFKTQTSDSNSAYVGYLRGSDAAHRADPIFIMTWTAEGTMEPKVGEIPVVQEYADVFPEELSGLPPEREIEFTIALVPGVQPISKAPYRMAPTELAELKKQIQELIDKGFIQPSMSH